MKNPTDKVVDINLDLVDIFEEINNDGAAKSTLSARNCSKSHGICIIDPGLQ